MRKIIWIVPVAVIFAVLFVFFFNFQTISTDKTEYKLGETIFINHSDFRLYRCSCSGPQVKIYQEMYNEWKMKMEWRPISQHIIRFGDPVCLNGSLVGSGMPVDVCYCDFLNMPIHKWQEQWAGMQFQYVGETADCNIPSGFIDSNRSFPSYTSLVIPGKYKISYGIDSKIIEIVEN